MLSSTFIDRLFMSLLRISRMNRGSPGSSVWIITSITYVNSMGGMGFHLKYVQFPDIVKFSPLFKNVNEWI